MRFPLPSAMFSGIDWAARGISDIARDVGFGTPNRTCEIYRREVGITPSEYRKQRKLEVEM